jgi:FtsP/CotA-like multicopper oxidase with cupredoxin domain
MAVAHHDHPAKVVDRLLLIVHLNHPIHLHQVAQAVLQAAQAVAVVPEAAAVVAVVVEAEDQEDLNFKPSRYLYEIKIYFNRDRYSSSY